MSRETKPSGETGNVGSGAFASAEAARPARPRHIRSIHTTVEGPSRPYHKVVNPNRIGASIAETVFSHPEDTSNPHLHSADTSNAKTVAAMATSDGSIHVRLADAEIPDDNEGARKDITKADVDVIANGKTARTLKLAKVTWKNEYYDSEKMTTDPEIVEAVRIHGPSAFDQLDLDEGQTEVITLDTDTKLQRIPFMHTLTYDGTNGLITVHRGEPYDNVQIHGEPDTVAIDGEPNHYYSNPHQIFAGTRLYYGEEYLYEELPQVRDAFSALGIDQTHTTKTIPTPGEYKRRMDHLRETDTTSGVYYPEIELTHTGKIDPKTYANAYANRRHPVGSTSFDYYTHDIAADHAVAFKVYGEPLMDVLSNFAQVVVGLDDKDLYEIAAGEIDRFTGNIGGRGFREPLPDMGAFSNAIVNTLRSAQRLDQLQIVQWMQERRMIRDINDVTTDTLYLGLRAQAVERFAFQE